LSADKKRRGNEFKGISIEEERRIRDIYNTTRRIGYQERKEEINARRRELFAGLSEEDKEYIRENDRERYHNSTYMRLHKARNQRKYRAKKKSI
jgi:hypothetical protein